jgi:hypothetical protein
LTHVKVARAAAIKMILENEAMESELELHQA